MNNCDQHKISDSTLIRYIQKLTSEKEDKMIESWLLKQDNHNYLNKLEKLWQHGSAVEDFDLINMENDWEKVKARIENVDSCHKIRKSNPAFSLIARIAAIIVLAVGITFLLRYYLLAEPEMIVLSTELNQREILLPDGSTVYLNQHSRLSYPEKFSKKERAVNLNGEAYFEVSRNEKRSFIVRIANNAIVKVLGTSFNIKTDTGSSTVAVHVTTGKVSFYKAGEPNRKTVLTKNEEAVLENGHISKSVIDDPNFMSWKTGILVFKNSRLSNVVDQLIKFYKQPIVLKDQSRGDYKYTSTIDNQPLDEVLEEITLVFDLDYAIKNDTVFILPRQQPL